MDGRRARGLSTAALLCACLVLAAVTFSARPVDAATCQLTAPALVQVGTGLTIQGSGFPASSPIDVTFAEAGAPSDEFTVTSDTAGAFVIDLTAEASDVGVITVTAVAGSICTVEALITVVAPGGSVSPGPTATASPTPAPSPTSSPHASPRATRTPAPRPSSLVLAATPRPTPPRSDAPSPMQPTNDASRLLGLGILMLGLVGVVGASAVRRIIR